MEMEKNEKVLAMYNAVWELLDEGCDIHDLKVADITGRAGIGKGTAYEYFHSKEELVQKALRYEFLMQYQELKEILEKQNSFRKGIYSCFSWMENTTERRKRFSRQAVRQNARSLSEGEEKIELCPLKEQNGGGFLMLQEILRFLVALGKKDGVISREVPDKLASLQILSQFLGFSVYQEMRNSLNVREAAQIKDFLYDTIRKSLQ